MILRRNLLSSQVSFTRLQASLLILFILLVSQGCATTPPILWSPHLKEEVRAQIHTIDVVVDETLPRVILEGPSKGALSGAGRKAGKWSANWALAALAIGAGLGPGPAGAVGVAMLALTPVVAVTGAVVGASEAPSAETVESQEAQVRGMVQVEDLLQFLEKHVRVRITERTDISLAAPQGKTRTPVGPQDIVTTVVPPQSAVLTIHLQSLDFQEVFDADSPLALHLKAQVTLATPTDAPPLYDHTFQYVTRMRPLTEWLAEDAKEFHTALELGLARLAELIVDDVLVTYPFAHEFVHQHDRVLYAP